MIYFSLIATVFNEAANITRFLESYANQTAHATEFVIVDGGSTDDTPGIIQRFADEHPQLNIRLIVDPTCSRKFTTGPIARGRNVAIQAAKYDLIAVTDAGCILDKNWFAEISAPFNGTRVDVVAGWYEANVVNNFSAAFAEAVMPRLNRIDPATFLPSSRSIAFHKACWERVGGYPTATLTGEDTKFDLELKSAGFKFLFAPRAIVRWDCPQSYKEMLIKQYRYGKGDGALRINKMAFVKNTVHLLLPIKLLSDRLSGSAFSIKYILILANHVGYLAGVLKG